MQDQETMEKKMEIAEAYSKPLTDWPNEPSVMTLEEDMAMARQWNQEHSTKVENWLALRNIEGAHKPKTKTNQSSVQPKLVRRQNEWRYSALTEPFLSSEEMFTVKPTTWEDVASAKQNQQVLNWQFRTKLNPVKFIDAYVRTAVDEGSVIVRLGWRRETEEVETEVPVWTYSLAQDPMYMQQLQQSAQLMQMNPQGFQELPLEIQKGVEYSMQNGVPAMAEQTGTTTAIEEKVVKNHPTVEIVNYKNIFIDPSCEGDISKANFVITSFETSKAELLKDGRYKNLDKVNYSSQTPHHQPDHATNTDDATQFKDELRKRVVAYEYWGWYDIKKDGVLRPIVATWIGKCMIRMEENPFPDKELPFVVVPYMPVKESVTGEPDAELLGENQKVLGAVTRGMIDLMAKSANGQTGFAKGMLDVVNRRRYDKGEDYEYNPDGANPAQSIYQHSYPEIPASAMNMLGLQNQEAEAITGVKAFSGGLSGEAYGDVAAGIKGMLDASAKREMGILRRLAQGIEEIGRKIIAMNGVFLEEEEVVEITNEEFVTILRDDLVGEFNLKVDIATAEVDQAKAEDLGFMLQTLGNNIPFEITKRILAQIARLKRMPELEHMLEQFEPQPDPIEEKMKELEMAKLDAEIRRINSQADLDEAKIQGELADARKTASEADLKDLDFLETETGTKHLRDMDKLGAQGAANQDLEITKALLNPTEGVTRDQKNRDITEALGFKQFSSTLTT